MCIGISSVSLVIRALALCPSPSQAPRTYGGIRSSVHSALERLRVEHRVVGPPVPV